MSEILNQLKVRHSINDYGHEPIAEADKSKIFESMSYTPRAGNLQHFSVLEVSDPASKKNLSTIVFQGDEILNAATTLIFFADLRSTSEWFKEDGTDYPFWNLVGYQFAMTDATLAAMAAVMVSEELGYGTCFMGGILHRAPAISSALQLPSGVVPLFGLCIGRAQEQDGKLRFNLPYSNFVTDNPKKLGQMFQDMYVRSGKQDADKAHMLERIDISARVKGRELSTQKIIAEIKYAADDILGFSKNLKRLLEKSKIL